ncbi:MAG TPA: hypothetical protein PLN69_11100 [bacterium]|nr:hypothetical protein [bacterium]
MDFNTEPSIQVVFNMDFSQRNPEYRDIVILKNNLEYMHKGNSFVHGTLSLYL